jgi:demethylspheroidene O-methyltransferase
MGAAAATLDWRDRWLARRDRLLTDPRFREAASRFVATRPIARRQARGLFDLVAGFVYSQWLFACVELGLFERLARAPLTAAELARESDLPLLSAERLLDAATALGLTQERAGEAGQRRFGLGPLGAALVDNEAVTSMVRHHRALYADLADPLALLRRGRGGGEVARYWAYAQADRPGALEGERVDTYSALMASSQPLVAGQVLDAFPLRRHRHLLDLGGGEGVFVATALQRHPQLRATLFDLPAVAARARERLGRLGLADRAQTLGGDFHRDALPTGADVVSLVRVIYDHDDAPALDILRAARRALPEGGTLLLAEPMADTAGAEPMGAAYFGMYLLAMGSGRSRSVAQLTDLLHRAGFERVRVRPTALPLQAGLLVARAGPLPA